MKKKKKVYKHKELFKKLTMVRLRKDVKDAYQNTFENDDVFVFLGDVLQMPGHGVFVGWRTKKVYAGYHTDSFEAVPEEEC